MKLNKKEINAIVFYLTNKKVIGKKFYSVPIRDVFEISKNGVIHALNRNYGKTDELQKIEVELIKNLLEVISNSIYVSFEANNKISNSDKVKGVHNHYNIVLFNKKLYEVWFKIKETKDKLFFYDLGIIREIK